jgi:hypothetical protein
MAKWEVDINNSILLFLFCINSFLFKSCEIENYLYFIRFWNFSTPSGNDSLKRPTATYRHNNNNQKVRNIMHEYNIIHYV